MVLKRLNRKLSGADFYDYPDVGPIDNMEEMQEGVRLFKTTNGFVLLVPLIKESDIDQLRDKVLRNLFGGICSLTEKRVPRSYDGKNYIALFCRRDLGVE